MRICRFHDVELNFFDICTYGGKKNKGGKKVSHLFFGGVCEKISFKFFVFHSPRLCINKNAQKIM